MVDQSSPGADQVISFYEALYGSPVWFRVTVGRDGLVTQAEVGARGHFMDHRYIDLNAAISIQPPVA